jgi:mannitol-1-phosphate 5-dehydrogenase
VVIGAGKIGCGFLAPLFQEAGWDVVVAARSEAVVERMRAAGEYTVRTTGAGGIRRVRVTPVLTGSPAFDDAVAGAHVVATAVGSASVAALGVPLARALAARPAGRPLDVWTVENGDVAPQLQAALRESAARLGLRLPRVGVAGAIAYAAVTQGDWRGSPRPEFVSDTAKWLLVDAAPLVAAMPRLPRVGATASYAEHLEGKRFVFSAGHAMCAFIGARHGHRWLHDAAADPRIRPLVADALVASRHALGGGDDDGPVGWVLDRYANAELLDTVRRVARDPIRKLAPEGPLVGPARLVARSAGAAPIGFATAIASALNYRDGADPQACLLAEMLVSSGLATVLSDVCGLDRAEPLARQVMRIYQGWEPAIARGTLSDPLALRRAA